MRAGLEGSRWTRVAVAIFYTGTAVLAEAPVRLARAEEDLRRIDVDANERSPLALLVISPTKEIAGSSAQTVQAKADELLRQSTDLKVRLFDESQAARCEERSDKFSCFVQVIWDYDPTSPRLKYEDGRVKRFSDVVSVLKKDNPQRSAFMVVLSSFHQMDGSSRLTPLLIDTESALQFVHQSVEAQKYDQPAVRDEVEGKIAQFSVKKAPAPRKVDPAGLDDYLHELFLVEFRPELEKAGHWEPYGMIELQVAQAGLEIEIDNQKIGVTKAGRTLIGHVLPGAGADREVKLALPGYITASAKVKVDKQKTTMLAMRVDKQPDELARTANRTLFWTGIGVAAIGAALTVLAIESKPGNGLVCLKPMGQASSCASPEFVNFGARSASDPPMITSNPNGSGLPIAPLGYSIAGAGAVWAGSTALFSDDETLPIVELGAGVAVFLASYLLSVALNGKNCLADGTCTGKH